MTGQVWEEEGAQNREVEKRGEGEVKKEAVQGWRMGVREVEGPQGLESRKEVEVGEANGGVAQ